MRPTVDRRTRPQVRCLRYRYCCIPRSNCQSGESLARWRKGGLQSSRWSTSPAETRPCVTDRSGAYQGESGVSHAQTGYLAQNCVAKSDRSHLVDPCTRCPPHDEKNLVLSSKPYPLDGLSTSCTVAWPGYRQASRLTPSPLRLQ